MVQIKLLDKGPFYYHQYEKPLYFKQDEFGEWCREQPNKKWLLPYQPAYINTNEEWLIERLKKYAEGASENVDIINDSENIFCCSIPQELLAICVPPEERVVKNKLPRIPEDHRMRASDGHRIT